MSEPLSGPIKAITGNGTLTTQYIVHFSASFQFRDAVRRGRHVTRSEILPPCFIITDEAVLSGAIQTAPMTKLAVVRGSQSQRQRSCLFWRRRSGSVERAPQWLSHSYACSPLGLGARGFRVAPELLSFAMEPPGWGSTRHLLACSETKERMRVAHEAKAAVSGTGSHSD